VKELYSVLRCLLFSLHLSTESNCISICQTCAFLVAGLTELTSWLVEQMNAGELDLIDVREEDEVKATGPFQTTAEGSSVDFPGAVVATAQNLPLSAIKIGALHMNDDDFEEAFGFVKPRMDRHTVFACRSGMRSGTACGIAKGAGYQQLSNYKGSALEWFGEK
jgi:rhodanese-related sulfurtransferase